MEPFYVKLELRVIRGGNPNRLLVLINYGIGNDQWILGIGEVYIFHQRQQFFHEMMVSPCCAMNSIASCKV